MQMANLHLKTHYKQQIFMQVLRTPSKMKPKKNLTDRVQ